MLLYANFLILNFQLGHIFAFPPNPLELSSQAKHDLKGYECGNVFFTDKEVNEALLIGLNSLDKEYRFPEIYRGPLYSESKIKEYLLYPIKNGQQFVPYAKNFKTVFRVVFTRNSNEAVDVVAKTTTNDYTRCFRRDCPINGPSHLVPGNANGYLCAHEFFTDETIQESLALAQNSVEENPMYPSAYVGRLYPEKSGLLMWPIIKGDKLYTSGKSHIGSYFLILNRERQLFDVVIKGYNKNILRCIRSRKPPTAPESDPLSKLFVPPPKPGFLCGKLFFNYNVLKENAEIVKVNVGSTINNRFPEEYFGPPCNQRCLMWPILRDGSLFKRGSVGPYRLILSSTYEVKSVVMFAKSKIMECESSTIARKKYHEISRYHCNLRQFGHQQLEAAAEEACVRMKTSGTNHFPASYQGPRFKLDGPYFTYPVFRKDKKKFTQKAGLHRVVINLSCEVVGALTTVRIPNSGDSNNMSRKRMVKCHRLADGPLPPGFFMNAETVFEGISRHIRKTSVPM